jgi:hypothetical protein
MRARLIVLAGGVFVGGAALAVQACGGDDTGAPAEADWDGASGSQQAPAPAGDDAAACDPTTSFTDRIPDAPIGDSGATTGACVQCATTKCAEAIGACDQSCACQGVAAGALQCYLNNADSPIVCVASLANVDSETRQLGFQMLLCINAGCAKDCAIGSVSPGDSGSDGAVSDGAVGDGAVSDGAVSDGALGDGDVADGAVAEGGN